MLSRRDKLLIQPWHERRFRDHRAKVQSALPAVDATPPTARPHVTMKLKKFQKELDRETKIQRDNYSLLQRLSAIMKVNRLDNHWTKPLPNFQHKVGLYLSVPSSGVVGDSGRSTEDSVRCVNVKCYACEYRKRSGEHKTADEPRSFYLPSI